MMCRWTTRGHERLSLPGAKSRAEHFADRPVYDLAARAWLVDFLGHWMHVGAGRTAQAIATLEPQPAC
jgi:GMP synthase (glutamine-hydrolysing)